MPDNPYDAIIAAATLPKSTPPPKTSGLLPEMEQHWGNLQSEFQKAGMRPPAIKSGFRTAEQQNALHRAGKPTKGNDGYINISPHQEGRALDLGGLNSRGRKIVADYARRNGLHVPSDEPWHIAIPKTKAAVGGSEYDDIVQAATVPDSPMGDKRYGVQPPVAEIPVSNETPKQATAIPAENITETITRPRTVGTADVPPARPADEFTSADTVDVPLPPFDKQYTGALGQIGDMGSQAQQAYLQFVRNNIPPGPSQSIDKAASDENLAQTFVKIQDFLTKNPEAGPKDVNRGLAQIGADFLKDPNTKGSQLPRAVHDAMLSAQYTPEEWATLPKKLQSQVRAHRAELAASRGREKAVKRLQSDIQVLGPTVADWYPDLDFHLRMKPGEFQSLTKGQQRKVVGLIAGRVRADQAKRAQGQEIQVPTVDEEIALRKKLDLPRRPITPLNIDVDMGRAPSRQAIDWSDLISVQNTPESIKAIQREAETSLQKRESARSRATASATPENDAYKNFLLQNRAVDSPQMREQFGALATKQYDAAQLSPEEKARQERVSKIGLFTNADGSWGGKIGQIAPGVFGGLASAGGEMLKSIAMLGQMGQGQMLGTQASDNPLYKLGAAIEKAVPAALGSNPDLEQEMAWGKLPAGAGNMIAFIAGGTLTKGSKIAIALLGAGMEAPIIYEEIKEGGGSEREALAYGLLGGGILGSTEIIGFTGALNALKGTAGEALLKASAKRAIRIGKAAGRDSLLNTIQEVGQAYGEGVFSGKPRTAQQLKEAGILGGILGGVTTAAVATAATSPPRGTKKEAGNAELQPDAGAVSVRDEPRQASAGSGRLIPAESRQSGGGESLIEKAGVADAGQRTAPIGAEKADAEVQRVEEVAKEVPDESAATLNQPAQVEPFIKPARLAEDRTLSQAVRAEGGIRLDIDKANQGELSRLSKKEAQTTGLVNKNSRNNAEDMALRMAEDGYRGDWVDVTMGPHGPQFSIDGNKFIEAVEMDQRGITPILRGDKPIDFEAEYRRERPDEAEAHDAVVSLMESDSAGVLYDKIIGGQANETEITEFREAAKNFGVTTEDAEYFIREGERYREAAPERVSDTAERQASEVDAEMEALRSPERSAALQKALKESGYDSITDPRVRKHLMDAAFKASMAQAEEVASPTGETEERFTGIPILRTLLSGRPRTTTITGLESEIPEVEARWKAAKGIQSPGMVAKAKESLSKAYQSFKRHFPHLDPKKDSVTAISVDTLRQYESAPDWAKAVAIDQLSDITGNLDAKAVDVMTRVIALPDIIKDVEAGKYTDKEELPFGYKTTEEVETDLAKFQDLVDKNPAIKAAIDKRQKIQRDLATKLVSMDLLPEKVLEDPRYYHRQVMEYFNAIDPNYVGTGSSDLRLKQKGFQKGRSGGSDFNTRYQEAEFEWMAQAYSLIARKETLDRLQKVADIRLALELQAKALRDAGHDVKWKDLIPETHRIWQPEKGNHFFMGLTVAERAMDQILSGEKEFETSDVRQMLVMGGPKQQWVIPKELAQTLDEFNPRRQENALERAWVGLQSGWKQWVLLNPKRVLKYNINNTSGDLDIVLAYDPMILKEAVPAARDLWRYHISDKASPALKSEIQAAMKKGVVGSTMTTAEIPDINKEGPFRLLTDEKVNPLSGMVRNYWNAVKGFTVWRENVMRLAAYRHFQKSENLGDILAVSDRKSLEGIEGDERAAKLARELLGDYGNISDSGQWLRRHMMNFYSWIEINSPRYYRLLKNLPMEEGGLGRAGRSTGVVVARTAWSGTKTIAKAHILFTLATLWNRLRFPEEEEKMQREGQKLHIILGKNEDGSIRSIRFQGALSDMLEWFALDDYPQDLASFLQGEKTGKDMAAEAVKAPVERFVQAFEPFTKTLIEEATGRSTYPRLFQRGASFDFRSNPIRDRKEHALRLFSLDGLYRSVTGKPSPPVSKEFPWSLLDMAVTYRTDPNEAAYWQVRTKAAKYAQAKGKETSGPGDPTERQNALYYFKKATQWGDEKAAKRWLAEYEKLGGSEKGLEQSLRLSHPLGGLARKHWQEFKESLGEEEKQQLQAAEDWYERIYNYKPKRITPREKNRWRSEERKERRETKELLTERRYNVQPR